MVESVETQKRKIAAVDPSDDWKPAERSRRRRRIAWLGVLAVVAILSGLWLAKPGRNTRPPTAKVERGTIERRLLLDGRVQPSATYSLNFPIPSSGADVGPNIEEVMVKAGDRVSSGQILARLEGDRVESAYIRSPVDGVVVEVRGAPGAPPPQGAVVVVRTLELEASFNLSEANLAELSEGMEATLTIPVLSKAFAVTITNLPHDPQPQNPGLGLSLGSMEGGAAGATAQAINYSLEVPLPGIEGLRPGMSVNLDVQVGRRENVLVVPQQALRYDDQGAYVEVLDGSARRPVRVEVGLTDESNAEVSGLQEGQEVVLAG
jgi:multidrug efflux pump subunit AcrA (membrane-fusion protein)